MKDQDLMTIKKFSELTGISQSALRHYDEVDLFKPVKRDENGYRYYSAPQTISANLIHVMHDATIPIRKIREFIKHREPEQILKLFRKQETELNRELLRIQRAYSILHVYCELIEEGLHEKNMDVHIRFLPEMPIELGPINDFSSGFLYDSYFYFLKQLETRQISTSYPCGGFYDDMDSFMSAPGQPNRYFSQVPTGRDTKPAGEYLVGYSRGYYGKIGDLPETMLEYAKDHKLTFTGPVYEMYLFDEVVIANPDQYLIQVSVPVKKEI